MIENVFKVDELRSLARLKKRNKEIKTVPKKAIEDFRKEGQKIERKNINSFKIVRFKEKNVMTEDRVPYIFDINDFPSFRHIPEAISLICNYVYNTIDRWHLLPKSSAKVQGK